MEDLRKYWWGTGVLAGIAWFGRNDMLGTLAMLVAAVWLLTLGLSWASGALQQLARSRFSKK